jgi:hydrogenase/urease accessory protein HupE
MQNLLIMALDRSVETGITLSVTALGLQVALERGRLVDASKYAK